MSMLQFLYDLFRSQYFGILVIIWVVIDLVWIDRWKSLIGRIGKLIAKPWIFSRDKEPYEPHLYPREFLEQLALNSRRESKTDSDSKTSDEPTSRDSFQKWTTVVSARVFDIYNPIRALGHVLALAFFVFFLLANAITIANTMVLLALISPDLPPFLLRLEISMLGGTLVSAIVSVWILVELSGKGELINVEQLTSSQKSIFKSLSMIVLLFSSAGMIALAIQRLVSLGSLEATPTSDLILSFILYGVITINSALSAAIIFQPAASGLLVVVYLLIVLIVGFLPVIVFILDVLWRTVYIVIDSVLWVVFTPIIAMPYGITKILSFRR
ncbi:MAG: hypothetical protein ACYC6R_09020 [Anaerolineales bacterium]